MALLSKVSVCHVTYLTTRYGIVLYFVVAELTTAFATTWSPGVLEKSRQGFDVAVLKLAESINDTSAVASINRLGNVPQDGQGLFTLGFGTGDNLTGITYNYVDQCQTRFPRYNPTFFLCADASPTKGTCYGDAGGPVVLNGTSTVVGLNSFSNNVCGSQTVDISTRVSTYYDWIIEQICDISNFVPPGGCPPGCLISNLLYRSVKVFERPL
jgi:Trypsin